MLRNATEDLVFVYTWEIPNFSFCGHKKGNPLLSPRFIIHSLQSSFWSLSCYPRGNSYDNFVGVFLQRAASDDEPREITIGYEIALVDTNDSCTYFVGYQSCCFRHGGVIGADLIAREELLGYQKSTLLPEDTLTFRCRIWKKYVAILCPTYCFSRTCIGVHQSVFNWTLSWFSSFPRNQRIPFYVCAASMQYALLTMEIFLNNDDKIQIDITGSCGRNTSRLTKLKITLLDSNGRTERFVEDEHLFTSKEEVWRLNTNFSRPELIEQKIRFLPWDEFTLLCHCRISDGIESSRIGRTVCEVHPADFKNLLQEEDEKNSSPEANTASEPGQLADGPHILKCENKVTENKEDLNGKEASSSGSQQNTSADSVAENRERRGHCDNICTSTVSNSQSDSLNSDLKCLYQEGTVSDFTIKVGVKAFSVHKALLCARSPVLKAMLTSNMKETVSQVMDISDLDVDTVSRLLIFIYTDAADDLEWEAATRLYFAADKYGITALKLLCSRVLKSSVCVTNVGDILALAELHFDSALKETVNDFLFTHDTEVMCSVEWKNFMQKEVQLAAETMRLMYMKKSGNI